MTSLAGSSGTWAAGAGSTASRVLVVGCGFIGAHAAVRIAEGGHPVTVLSRRRPPERVARVADVVLGDARDPAALTTALDGVRHVFWSAGGLLPPDAERDPEADERLTLAPLRELLRQLGDRTDVSVTFISSGGTVYGNPAHVPVPEDAPTNPIGVYGRTRLAAERLLLSAHDATGVEVRVLRCANVYGEHQPAHRSQGAVAVFLERVRNGEEIVLFGGGTAVRDFVHVGDVVDVAGRLLGREGANVVNVGSGEGTSIRRLLTLVERTVGRRANVAERPAREFDVDTIVLDVRRLQRLIPYAPIDLEAGLVRTAAVLDPHPSPTSAR